MLLLLGSFVVLMLIGVPGGGGHGSGFAALHPGPPVCIPDVIVAQRMIAVLGSFFRCWPCCLHPGRQPDEHRRGHPAASSCWPWRLLAGCAAGWADEHHRLGGLFRMSGAALANAAELGTVEIEAMQDRPATRPIRGRA